mmetsp:Transcript_51186/g.90041  ORF Transcript_51186/g.90041 Transcript_51186/m.90041 type:complete len:225 (-) Transcript_51186:1183-1857(-)
MSPLVEACSPVRLQKWKAKRRRRQTRRRRLTSQIRANNRPPSSKRSHLGTEAGLMHLMSMSMAKTGLLRKMPRSSLLRKVWQSPAKLKRAMRQISLLQWRVLQQMGLLGRQTVAKQVSLLLSSRMDLSMPTSLEHSKMQGMLMRRRLMQHKETGKISLHGLRWRRARKMMSGSCHREVAIQVRRRSTIAWLSSCSLMSGTKSRLRTAHCLPPLRKWASSRVSIF